MTARINVNKVQPALVEFVEYFSGVTWNMAIQDTKQIKCITSPEDEDVSSFSAPPGDIIFRLGGYDVRDGVSGWEQVRCQPIC